MATCSQRSAPMRCPTNEDVTQHLQLVEGLEHQTARAVADRLSRTVLADVWRAGVVEGARRAGVVLEDATRPDMDQHGQ